MNHIIFVYKNDDNTPNHSKKKRAGLANTNYHHYLLLFIHYRHRFQG